jgi:hypothetical protein
VRDSAEVAAVRTSLGPVPVVCLGTPSSYSSAAYMHARSLRTPKKHQETVSFCVLEGGFSYSHSNSEPTLTPRPRPVANTFILDAFSGRKTWMLTGKSSGVHDDCVFTLMRVHR